MCWCIKKIFTFASDHTSTTQYVINRYIMLEFIKIEKDSSAPKYKQIIESIMDAIDKNAIRKDQKMPSINEVCKQFNLSRDTVLTAFNELKARGILASQPGKGYYINKATTGRSHNILLLFDKLTAYKEVLYDSFKQQFSRNATIDIFFHHFNPSVFKTLIEQSIGKYTAYVIMPIPSKSVQEIIDLIPKDKLYILDMGRSLYGKNHTSVCQNFKKDTYEGLTSGIDLLKKYKKITLVFPDTGHTPNSIKKGFVHFCKDKGLDHDVTSTINEEMVEKDEAYMVIDDKHLVKLVQFAQRKHLTLGKDFGIVSYNDTPLKSVVSNGITTISTDFAAMGKNMAQLILEKQTAHIDNPSSLIQRNSL